MEESKKKVPVYKMLDEEDRLASMIKIMGSDNISDSDRVRLIKARYVVIGNTVKPPREFRHTRNDEVL